MSDTRPFHMEDLVGKVVRDASGRTLGRIFEMVAEERDGELVIVEFHLGRGAFLEQVSASVRSALGLPEKKPRCIAWTDLDLSNPQRPVATSP